MNILIQVTMRLEIRSHVPLLLRSRSLRGPETSLRSSRRCIATFTHSQHAIAMSVLPTSVDKKSDLFKENDRSMSCLLNDMKDLHSRISLGGSEKARSKHVARGKMLPREYALSMTETNSSNC